MSNEEPGASCTTPPISALRRLLFLQIGNLTFFNFFLHFEFIRNYAHLPILPSLCVRATASPAATGLQRPSVVTTPIRASTAGSGPMRQFASSTGAVYSSTRPSVIPILPEAIASPTIVSPSTEHLNQFRRRLDVYDGANAVASQENEDPNSNAGTSKTLKLYLIWSKMYHTLIKILVHNSP